MVVYKKEKSELLHTDTTTDITYNNFNFIDENNINFILDTFINYKFNIYDLDLTNTNYLSFLQVFDYINYIFSNIEIKYIDFTKSYTIINNFIVNKQYNFNDIKDIINYMLSNYSLNDISNNKISSQKIFFKIIFVHLFTNPSSFNNIIYNEFYLNYPSTFNKIFFDDIFKYKKYPSINQSYLFSQQQDKTQSKQQYNLQDL